jgi:hypothetical protein
MTGTGMFDEDGLKQGYAPSRRCSPERSVASEGRLSDIMVDERRRGAMPKDGLAELGLMRASDGGLGKSGADSPRVQVWGSGIPRRVFLSVADLADARIRLMTVHFAAEVVDCRRWR